MDDLSFLAGEFINYKLPQKYKFLEKYLKSKKQKDFLPYYIFCRNLEETNMYELLKNFSDHTGCGYNSWRDLYRVAKKIECILKEHEDAKKNFDIARLSNIEKGGFLWNQKRFKKEKKK